VVPGATVLDLGAGNGVPTAVRLARRYVVEGIDVSSGQVELARAAVPGASFQVADMTTVTFEPGSFDAVVALYTIIHVPRDLHRRVFRRISSWLRPGGWLLAALGGAALDDSIGDWLGVRMFFSSPAPDESLRLLADAGLDVAEAEVVAIREPDGDVPFLWVLASKLDERAPSVASREPVTVRRSATARLRR
jgi:SAM-dependent methyltransferase